MQEHMVIPVTTFRKMTVESTDETIRYYCYMEIHDIPHVWSAFNTHREEPDGGAAEEEQVPELMLKHPQQFHLMTKGITMRASRVLYDNRPAHRSIDLILDDSVGDGIYRGGALLEAIFRYRNEDVGQRRIYVEVEMITGIDPSDMEQMEYQRSL